MKRLIVLIGLGIGSCALGCASVQNDTVRPQLVDRDCGGWYADAHPYDPYALTWPENVALLPFALAWGIVKGILQTPGFHIP